MRALHSLQYCCSASPWLFRLRIGAFALYAWVVSYLLVGSGDHHTARLVFYAVAMALHFVSVANTLREEHGQLYERRGAPLLAGACAAGWVCGMTIQMHEPVLGILLGLVAGGVMANTVISELPRERQGRLAPFVLGALGFAFLLLLA